jgi:hypothetical protein
MFHSTRSSLHAPCLSRFWCSLSLTAQHPLVVCRTFLCQPHSARDLLASGWRQQSQSSIRTLLQASTRLLSKVKTSFVLCAAVNRTACIPKHIPRAEKMFPLAERHMSILKVRMRRAPQQVNLLSSSVLSRPSVVHYPLLVKTWKPAV